MEEELIMLQSMTSNELQLMFIVEEGTYLKLHMKRLAKDVKEMDWLIAYAKREGDQQAKEYDMYGDESSLDNLELCAELHLNARNEKRRVMQTIKETGERLRWLRNQYRMIKKKNDEQS